MCQNSGHPQSAFDPNPEESSWPVPRWSTTTASTPLRCRRRPGAGAESTIRTWHVVGLFVFGFLLAMLRGNHVGHVEDCYLIGFAALALFVLCATGGADGGLAPVGINILVPKRFG